VPVGSSPIEVNRLLVGKGYQRYEVLYWYESRGRAVASEYTNKMLLVADAIRFNRSDGAIVRVMAPVGRSAERAERATTVTVRQSGRSTPASRCALSRVTIPIGWQGW